MNNRQEAEWLYAKGLEIAILIKGQPSVPLDEPLLFNDILKSYDELAMKAARKIIISSSELLRTDQP